MRARAFHIMDPKGVIEMLLVFLEKRSDQEPLSPSLANSKVSSRSSFSLMALSSRKFNTHMHPCIHSSTHTSTGSCSFLLGSSFLVAGVRQ